MPDPTDIGEALRAVVEEWTTQHRDNGKIVAGRVITAIKVVEKLRKWFPLEDARVATGSQISNRGNRSPKKILAAFGETRRLPSEGGRTSRGNMLIGLDLAHSLNDVGAAVGFESLADKDRLVAVDVPLRWLVELMTNEYFEQMRLEIEVRPDRPIWQSIAAIIRVAASRPNSNVAGAVAQHLVGAKLALRFPDLEIGRDSYTTADDQTARAGDFKVGDTIFHVTMAPAPLVVDKCRRNLGHGYRPVLIVPMDTVEAAVQLTRIAGIDEQVDVIAVEKFVGGNVEEMGDFSAAQIREKLRALLDEYNDRVSVIETDVSLLIEIPENL